jgi:hypothetical protein
MTRRQPLPTTLNSFQEPSAESKHMRWESTVADQAIAILRRNAPSSIGLFRLVVVSSRSIRTARGSRRACIAGPLSSRSNCGLEQKATSRDFRFDTGGSAAGMRCPKAILLQATRRQKRALFRIANLCDSRCI